MSTTCSIPLKIYDNLTCGHGYFLRPPLLSPPPVLPPRVRLLQERAAKKKCHSRGLRPHHPPLKRGVSTPETNHPLAFLRRSPPTYTHNTRRPRGRHEASIYLPLQHLPPTPSPTPTNKSRKGERDKRAGEKKEETDTLLSPLKASVACHTQRPCPKTKICLPNRLSSLS